MKKITILIMLLCCIFPLKSLGDDNRGSVNEYTKKGSKVFLEYFYPEGYEVCAEYGKEIINKHGIWKIVDNKDDADFILSVVTFNKVYPNPMYGDQIFFEAYSIICDKDYNLLWRGKNVFYGGTVFDSINYRIKRTQSSLIKSLINDLPKAEFCNTSIYSKNDVANRYIMPAEIAYDYQFFVSDNKSISDKKTLKQIVKNLKKISKKYAENKYVLELQARINLLLRDDNAARKHIKLLCIIDPINPNADSYYIDSFRIKYENQTKNMNTWNAINAGLNILNSSINAYNNATNTRSSSSTRSTTPTNAQSGKARSNSTSTYTSPTTPTYTDISPCDNRDCKNGWDEHYKEKCNRCNGTGKIKYNNVTQKWVSSDY